MTWVALGRALSGMAHVRLLLLFWVLSLLFAAVVAVPYGARLDTAIDRLPEPEEKAARLEASWHEDFQRANAPALDALADVAGAIVWLHVLLTAVLSGGVVAAFERRAARRRREEGRAWSYRVFFQDAGRWAWPMVRLFLLSLPLFYLVDLAVNDGLAKLFDDWFDDRADERIEVLATWWRQVILLVLLGIVATWFDLARARLVVDRRRSALLALSAAGGTILAKPGPVLAVAVPLLGLELLAMRLATWLGSGIETATWLALLTWLAVAQALVIFRLAAGFGRLAGYVAIAEEERDERETLARP